MIFSGKNNIKTILSFGANIGDIEKNFLIAKRSLMSAGLKNIKTSSLYKNKPFGCPEGSPDFINAAISGIWNEAPEKLYLLCKQTEIACGRPEDHPRWISRTLDIDIIFFGNLILKSEKLQIPHKEALKRLFVLIPITEIEPDFVIPEINCSISEYLNSNFSVDEITEFKKGLIGKL